jgi:hypothetical protein
MTARAQELSRTTGVPIDVLEALLRDHLADQTAVITESASAPLSHQGTNDSTSFVRVSFCWALSDSPMKSHTASWIIKHWKAGGVRDSSLGIIQPREALAWEHGWLRHTALPAGMIVPFIGARRSPDNTEAWLAMADVSTELSAYQRLSLSGEQVINQAQTILARLAQFHAMWEQPQRQTELQASRWLRRPEMYLWDMAPTYAQALAREPVAHPPLGVSAPPVWDGLSADLEAFLGDRSVGERQVWEHLLVDRRALVDGLAAYPSTLLHNDLDDRNIGLRWRSEASASEAPALDWPDLVLIDWEWIARGPAAIDVANVVQRAPIMIAPGARIPETMWADELADHYFAHYRAAGGRCADAAQWRRSFGLALVAQGLIQMPFIHGSLRRAIRGELPAPQIVGVSEATIRQNLRAGLPIMEQMEQRVIREARRWLG